MNGRRWVYITKCTTLNILRNPFRTLSSSKIMEEGMVLFAIFSNNVFAGADINRIAPAFIMDRDTAFWMQRENILNEKAIV